MILRNMFSMNAWLFVGCFFLPLSVLAQPPVDGVMIEPLTSFSEEFDTFKKGINGSDADLGMELSDELAVSGITEPLHKVTLRSDGIGRIARIMVFEGGHIQKGEVILFLDNQLEKLEANIRRVLWKNTAKVDAARLKEKALEKLWVDTRALFKKTRSVSLEELSKKELDYELAVAERKQQELGKIKEAFEYKLARARLEKRTLRSPIDGIVTHVYLEEGETSDSRQPLVRVVDTRRCLFVCNVEERFAHGLIKGEKVDLKIHSKDDFVQQRGHIVFVSPVVDPASSLLEVKVEFDNHDYQVRPGVPGFLLLKKVL